MYLRSEDLLQSLSVVPSLLILLQSCALSLNSDRTLQIDCPPDQFDQLVAESLWLAKPAMALGITEIVLMCNGELKHRFRPQAALGYQAIGASSSTP